MSFTTITNLDLANKGVTTLPDTPDMEASELKQRFDSLGNLCVSKIKTLVSELEAETASASLGASIPEGLPAGAKKVQSIIDALNVIVQQNAECRHNHANMDVLNSISEDDIDSYDQTALKLQGKTIENIVHNSDSEVPTSGAIIRYINSRLGG
jgi:hypothetical protein